MNNQPIDISLVRNPRECNGCTKCCEGWLPANIYGIAMYRGKPCHFKKQGGCSIYENRPNNPCKEYKCFWLTSLEVPEWMKPDESNVILTEAKEDNIYWIELTETDTKVDSSVLSWFFMYCINKNINFAYTVNGGFNFLGSPEFLELMSKKVMSNKE